MMMAKGGRCLPACLRGQAGTCLRTEAQANMALRLWLIVIADGEGEGEGEGKGEGKGESQPKPIGKPKLKPKPMGPSNKTALDRESHRKPLVAAAVRHTVKLGTHKRALEEAGDQGLLFMKGPLVFETTGAMGEGTQKCWKSIVAMEAD